VVPGVIVTNAGQAQFGIVQGSVFPDLREASARRTVDIGFEAYAIGGLSVGEPVEVMYDIVARTAPCLPADRPRYLMGTGTPEDLVESVARGIDRPALHEPREDQHQEREVRRGRPAARSCLPLLHVPDLFARLSAAPLRGRRDQRIYP
jgi:queuine tRNA-ribosyltransferase